MLLRHSPPLHRSLEWWTRLGVHRLQTRPTSTHPTRLLGQPQHLPIQWVCSRTWSCSDKLAVVLAAGWTVPMTETDFGYLQVDLSLVVNTHMPSGQVDHNYYTSPSSSSSCLPLASLPSLRPVCQNWTAFLFQMNHCCACTRQPTDQPPQRCGQ